MNTNVTFIKVACKMPILEAYTNKRIIHNSIEHSSLQ